MNKPKYDIEVQLSGNDGNAFSIMGRCMAALKKAGASEEEIKDYRVESTSGDCDKLLQTAYKWVVVL